MNKRANERTNERMKEQMNERGSEVEQKAISIIGMILIIIIITTFASVIFSLYIYQNAANTILTKSSFVFDCLAVIKNLKSVEKRSRCLFVRKDLWV